jgi:AmmeMemoRadiSam system protein B
VSALVVPHAALPYSGPVAAHAYLRLAEARSPRVIVIVGPDHYGLGPSIAVAPQDRWTTPLGEVETDHPVKEAMLQHGLPADGRGHQGEHCIEVQLPFLQSIGYKGAVIPILMADQEVETVVRLAGILTETLADAEATMIASTDLSHYLPHDRAVKTDRVVLSALAQGDGRHLLSEVRRHAVTMCGVGPAAAVLDAAGRLGGGAVEVLCYATSGEIGGDREAVVGYVAAVVEAAEQAA